MLRRKRIGRMVDHVLGFVTNRQHAVGALFDSNHRRLVDNDTLTGDGDQRIRSSKVDSHVRRHSAEYA